jgi:hypothetical protein
MTPVDRGYSAPAWLLAIVKASVTIVGLVCAGLIWSLVAAGSKTEQLTSRPGAAPASVAPAQAGQAVVPLAPPVQGPKVPAIPRPDPGITAKTKPARKFAPGQFDLRRASNAWPLAQIGDDGEIASFAISPEGKSLATVRHIRKPDFSGKNIEYDHRLKVWELATGKVRPGFGDGIDFKDGVPAFSADGQRVASISGYMIDENEGVNAWDSVSGKGIAGLTVANFIGPAGLSPAGKSKIFATIQHSTSVNNGVQYGAGVHLWRYLGPNEQRLRLGAKDARGFRDEVRYIYCPPAGCWVFTRDGKLLAAGCRDGHVYVWQIEDAVPPIEFKGHDKDSGVMSVAFSNDGKLLASASAGGTVILWDAREAKELGRCYLEPGSFEVVFTGEKSLHIGSVNGEKIKLYAVDLSRVPEMKSVYSPQAGVDLPGADKENYTLEKVRLFDTNPSASLLGKLVGYVAKGKTQSVVRVREVATYLAPGKEVLTSVQKNFAIKDVAFFYELLAMVGDSYQRDQPGQLMLLSLLTGRAGTAKAAGRPFFETGPISTSPALVWPLGRRAARSFSGT